MLLLLCWPKAGWNRTTQWPAYQPSTQQKLPTLSSIDLARPGPLLTQLLIWRSSPFLACLCKPAGATETAESLAG